MIPRWLRALLRLPDPVIQARLLRYTTRIPGRLWCPVCPVARAAGPEVTFAHELMAHRFRGRWAA